MNKLIVTLTFHLLFNFCFAQHSYINITGTIHNEENDPVPYVSIQLDSTSIGTVSNQDGQFELKIPSKYKDKRLLFSCIGYESIATKIESKLIINIHSSSIKIDEIIVNPIKPLDLLKSAIREIPNNYSNKPVYLNAFYRSLSIEDTNYTQLLEASCIFHSMPYDDNFDVDSAEKKYFEKTDWGNTFFFESIPEYFDLYNNPNDQVKVLEVRISENNSTKLNTYYPVGGSLGLFATNKAKYQNQFMDEKYFRFYKYSYKGQLVYNNSRVNVISFRPKTFQIRDINPGYVRKYYRRKFYKAEFEGDIYIDVNSLAFVKIEYQRVNAKPYYPNPYQVTVDFVKNGDKWYLSNIKRKSKNTQFNNVVGFEEEVVINSIVRNDVHNFSIEETTPNLFNYTLYKTTMPYNAEFWNNFNVLTFSKLNKKAKRDLQKQKSLEEQFMAMQSRNDTMTFPKIEKEPYTYFIHNEKITDNYKWLEEKNNPKVISYLNEQNKYTYNEMIPFRDLQEKLTKEFVAPYKENELTIDKTINGDYEYYLKYRADSEFAILCRKNHYSANEEELFDLNTWGENFSYLDIVNKAITLNNRYIAFTVDKDGSQHQALYILDMDTRTILADSINKVFSMVWANDNKTLFYVVQDTLNRPYLTKKHILGTNIKLDKDIFCEKDSNFDVYVSKTQFNSFIFIETSSLTTSELHYINANSPDGHFKKLGSRDERHFFRVKESETALYMLSNKENDNFGLYSCEKSDLNNNDWKFISGNDDMTLIKDFYIYNNHIVYYEVYNALPQIRITDLDGENRYILNFKEQIYSLKIGNFDDSINCLNIFLTSYLCPPKKYSLNLNTEHLKLINETKVPGFNPKNYIEKRIWVDSKDGVKIPVSIVYKKDYMYLEDDHMYSGKFALDGKNPLILEAYGSFGRNYFPEFSPDKISMLNRGFVYAFAHVRGGSEMGNNWHSQGALLNKKNSFNDYISCAEFLIKEGYTCNDKLFGIGGSAGGLLLGSVSNMRPDLFKGIVLEFPQVCQLDALLNSTSLHSEYGNPQEYKDFLNIISYSPYENVHSQNYPAMLFLSGYNDDRVNYWQPTKMVAKLQEYNTGLTPILLKTYNAGHVGYSGIYGYYNRLAFEYCFIISLLKN